jgi:hypothetical protein
MLLENIGSVDLILNLMKLFYLQMLKCFILKFKQVSLVPSKINPRMDKIFTMCTKGGNQNRYLAC